MKAEELRIGNFIYYSQSPEIGQPWDIFKANLNDIHSLQVSDSSDIRYAPIPLTEQWFEKFGGKKTEKNFYRLHSLTNHCDFIKLALMDGEFFWWCDQVIVSHSITYVHELQNLFFALTKQELLIEWNN